MSALTQARSTQRQGFEAVISGLSVPVAADTKCIQGGIAVLSGGYIEPGSTATGLVALGIFEDTADNSSGSAGAINARVRRGTFKFNNSSGADLIAQANQGQPAYIVDDNTVALTDGNGARSYAGAIVQIDSDGVWVELGAVIVTQPGQPIGTVCFNVDLPSIANNQVIASELGFAGRIKSVSFVQGKPVTTGAKAATLTAAVAGAACTGGAIALTSAACTPQGAEIDGSAITGGNEFTATQSVGVVASSVTTFSEGNGTVIVHLG